MLGHMKREFDLGEGLEELEHLTDEQFPFGDELRASPMKQASVTANKQAKLREGNTTLRRQLFERFKRSVREEHSVDMDDIEKLEEPKGKDSVEL